MSTKCGYVILPLKNRLYEKSSKVAKLFNISRETVKRYLNIEFSFVHGNKGIQKKNILDPYKEIID